MLQFVWRSFRAAIRSVVTRHYRHKAALCQVGDKVVPSAGGKLKARGQKKQKTKVFDYKLIIALLND
tara:strand:+ start:937 stop:1137 length:201 start_codon:yes stop_codon:yes gene_type:complete